VRSTCRHHDHDLRGDDNRSHDDVSHDYHLSYDDNLGHDYHLRHDSYPRNDYHCRHPDDSRYAREPWCYHHDPCA
jgi:hypothetical protein